LICPNNILIDRVPCTKIEVDFEKIQDQINLCIANNDKKNFDRLVKTFKAKPMTLEKLKNYIFSISFPIEGYVQKFYNNQDSNIILYSQLFLLFGGKIIGTNKMTDAAITGKNRCLQDTKKIYFDKSLQQNTFNKKKVLFYSGIEFIESFYIPEMAKRCNIEINKNLIKNSDGDFLIHKNGYIYQRLYKPDEESINKKSK
jgi:hypothetical protein